MKVTGACTVNTQYKELESDTHSGGGREYLMNTAAPALPLIKTESRGNSSQITEQRRSMKLNTALSVAGAILLNIAGEPVKLNIDLIMFKWIN